MKAKRKLAIGDYIFPDFLLNGFWDDNRDFLFDISIQELIGLLEDPDWN